MESVQDWRKDKWFLGALAVALLVRVLPMLMFPQGDCVRDECIYRSIAGRILDGQGMTVTGKGWLPAPGYPYLLAFMKGVFGVYWSTKIVQVPMALASTWCMYRIGDRVEGRKVGLIAAWLFALNPTLAFFTQTLWIETVYVFLLLFAVLWVLWAREGEWKRGLAPGMALGGATLFRGVATYLPPIFMVAVLWPEEGFSLAGLRKAFGQRWKHALALGLGWALTVAPYSIHASQRHGGFMLTDATAGHVMFLGNNDYPPLTFDYGNGMLTPNLYARWLRLGRRPCDRNQLPVVSNSCEMDQVKAWIRANPREFVSRVPERLAQLFNPNSFLTRHVRWGYWSNSWFPLTWWMKELIVISVLAFSCAIMLGGTLAAWTRARGPYAVMAAGTVLYTCATIALVYGMTRFRLPLEPLWTLYLAVLIAEPRKTLAPLGHPGVRALGAMVSLPVLAALIWRYLPTGFPMFW